MSDPPTEFRLALTTAGSDEQASAIARALVERRLAACVNIVHGVCSVYRWQGRIHDETEALLLIKTDAARVEKVREAVRELHSYEVPELLVLPVIGGDADYLDWLRDGLG